MNELKVINIRERLNYWHKEITKINAIIDDLEKQLIEEYK